MSERPDLKGAHIDAVERFAAELTLHVSRVPGRGVRRTGTVAFHGVTTFESRDERSGGPRSIEAGATVTRWSWAGNEVAFSTAKAIYQGEAVLTDVRLAFDDVGIELRLSPGATIKDWVGW